MLLENEEKFGSATLMELNEQANAIERMLIENDGELTPELEDAIQNIEIHTARKIDGYAFVIDRAKMLEKFWKEKAKTYTNVGRGCANLVKQIQDRLKWVMEEQEKPVIEGDEFRFSLTDIAKRLEIVDVDLLPDEYKIEKTVYEPDTAAIRAAIEAGEEIPGANLLGGKRLNRSHAKKGLE